jgi:hypothetical protein
MALSNKTANNGTANHNSWWLRAFFNTKSEYVSFFELPGTNVIDV